MAVTRPLSKKAKAARQAAARTPTVLQTFMWQGTDRRGVKMKGEHQAKTANMVRAELRRQGIVPTVVKVKAKPLFGSAGKRVKPKDIAVFSRQIATMMKSGVPLVQSLDILKKPSAPVYHVRFTGDDTAFLDRAKIGGVRWSREENGVVTLDGLDSGNVHLVWDWARETGTGVRSLTPTRNTLEQMFMEAVRDAGDAGSR